MTIILPFPLPRDWLHRVETALTNSKKHSAYAEALRAACPRDLDAVWVLLPKDVLITFEEVSSGTNNDA